MNYIFDKFTFSAMNTEITVFATGSDLKSEFKQVRNSFTAAEQKFSRFIPSSELSRLNTTGVLSPASGQMLQVLNSAMEYSVLTHGAFNPAIHDSLVAAGYSKSFELLGTSSSHSPDRFPSVPNLVDVLELDESDNTVHTKASIDLGGIVKGWATDLTSIRLRSSCEGWLVDAGGDIRCGGEAMDPRGWIIGVDDPTTGTLSDVICLREGAVATSSSLRRTWQSGNVSKHHIIEPSTGLPSSSGVILASVVAPSTELAEVIAKSIVISGETLGIKLLKQSGAEGRITRADGSIFATSGWPSFGSNPAILSKYVEVA